ncbi:MAG: hypothetical protein KJO07_24780 [Deltaproteobacteria bacterium]|nr:hypothetical protein [Deltaproteobacteria bacterium]
MHRRALPWLLVFAFALSGCFVSTGSSSRRSSRRCGPNKRLVWHKGRRVCKHKNWKRGRRHKNKRRRNNRKRRRDYRR